jgi:hypothetical protein
MSAQEVGGNAEARKVKNPVAANAASIEAGKTVYLRSCKFCHAEDAKATATEAQGFPPLGSDRREMGPWFHRRGNLAVIRNGAGPQVRDEAEQDPERRRHLEHRQLPAQHRSESGDQKIKRRVTPFRSGVFGRFWTTVVCVATVATGVACQYIGRTSPAAQRAADVVAKTPALPGQSTASSRPRTRRSARR